MPYKTDGSTHAVGVETEHAHTNLFNQAPPSILTETYKQPLQFVHKGGTKDVKDIDIVSASGEVLDGISVKHHGGAGTFDYINTSKVADFLPPSCPLVPAVAALKTAHHKQAESVAAVDRAIKTAISETWSQLTSSAIRNLLQTVDKRSPRWVCIKAPERHHVVPHTAFHELHMHPYDDTVVYELRSTPRAKSSRQIWRVQNGVATNTHIRLRIALNNGVHAFLGLPAANKSSMLTMKLQQDNVPGLLTQLESV